jgi:Skp family chaperone for outer membrane proteins
VFTKNYDPATSEPLVQASNRSTAQLRWFGNAAVALAMLSVFVLAPAMVSGQQGESTSQLGHRIALIDVAFIFKNLSTIQVEVRNVEDNLKKYEAELKQRRDALQQLVAQLKTLKSGTVDYARQEERIAALDSKLRLETNRKQKELADAEAKIYFDNYQRIAAAVKAIATHNNINLVLRFNSEDVDQKKNASVARGVAKNVVYHDSTINMTDTVMGYLERQASKAQIATGGRAASATNR